MTSEKVDRKGIGTLLSTISNQGVEVHVIMHMGKLAISGAVSIEDQSLKMDISGIGQKVLASIEPNKAVAAITFLDEKKISWEVSKISISCNNDTSKFGIFLVLPFPAEITRTSGRKDHRHAIDLGSLKIKIQGCPETFNLIDLSPSGCSFTAPSAISKTWNMNSVIGFEVDAHQMRLKNKLCIVRINFDLQNNSDQETVVSCKFENESFGRLLLDASLHQKA